MGKVIRAKPHLTLEEIDAHLKRVQDFWRMRRWMVIRHALVDPAPAKDIALRIGLSVFTVRDLIQSYNQHGSVAIETPGKGQRQRAYLPFDAEQAFVASFLERNRAGHLVTAQHIKKALEEYLGHPVSTSMVYRMLQRHQGHKIVSRSKHPHRRITRREDLKTPLVKKSSKPV